MKVTVIQVKVGALGAVFKGFGKDTGGTENQRKNQDHTDYSIVRVGLSTAKSPGDLTRTAVT